ncbi:hypothetical protein GALMADRAFT_150799 [Galerina marginata CBS 339.88]|uniref:STB6-like N-terminal domain-containing protein n=1 Tax=Galerina marginata (strain CBS 339.88) TaxID=685588 RepID=A0A067TKM6_GALM3|nr:hypothetical protein GALMADRAFT_150799 [Galerina marginata CBS 339.88]
MDNHVLLLPQPRLRFRQSLADIQIPCYQLYAVEKWIVQRRQLVLLVVYTGNPAHSVALRPLVPDSDAVWDDTLALLRADGARPKRTAHGVLMVTSLAHFRSDYTIVPVPDGNFDPVRDQLYANINLLRIGCSGRTALTLEDPSDSTKDRFISAYHLPDAAVPDHPPLPPPLTHSLSYSKPAPRGRPPSHNHSTASLPPHPFGKTKERATFVTTVLELVKLIQAGLAIFGLYPTPSTCVSPNLVVDGLLCDQTVEGIRQWVASVGGPCVGLEPTERIVDPSFVSALLSLVLSTRNKLAHLGFTFVRHTFPIHLNSTDHSQVLPRDPLLYPYTFSLALTAYIQSSAPPSTVPSHHPQTFTSPHGSIHVSSSLIPAAPPPNSILSAAAASAASAQIPVGAILTRDLVENISAAYDSKVKTDNRKVRRVIKNKLASANPTGIDSDGTEGDFREQRRHTLSMTMSLSAGEVPADRSPSHSQSGASGTGPGPSGIGSSGGQILNGIGSLASGLRLGTGGGTGGADGDSSALMVPTTDLAGFVAFALRCGSGVASRKERRNRKSKERRRETVDFNGAGIAVGYAYEKDAVVGGTIKALWSGRVVDVVRMREEAEGALAGPTQGQGRWIGERDKDTWKRDKSGVASDGDGESWKRYDGRSTEEESDNLGTGAAGGSVPSFGGMFRGKLGTWAGLAKRKNQSVDLGTMSSIHSPLKGKEKEKQRENQSSPQPTPPSKAPSPPQPSRLIIGNLHSVSTGTGSMSSRPSISRRSTTNGSGPQSPTLPPMVFSADGVRDPDDDDLLSSGQVSPLSDYRPNHFSLLNSGGTASAEGSSSNLGALSGISPEDYERTLTKLLGQKRPWSQRRFAQTGRISSWADPVSARGEGGEGEDEEGEEGSVHSTMRKRSREREKESEGEGEESDASRLGIGGDTLGARWKRKEKARFHSLLSVMDGEGVLVEEPLEVSEDEDSYDEDMMDDEESYGRRIGFDPHRWVSFRCFFRRKVKGMCRRRSFHDFDTFQGIEVLSPERMKIDVDICGHLLIMWRREEHLQNVIACTRLIADSLSKTNVALRTHYETHLAPLSQIASSSAVLASIEAERSRSVKILQSTNTLEYESAQFLVDDLWQAASPPRRKVFALREKVFGTGGRRLPPGMHGAHGPFNRLQWTLDGRKRLVDHLGRTESEAEEESRVEVQFEEPMYVDEEGRPATPATAREREKEEEEGEVVEHPGIKPMWLLRFFTSWGARWSAATAAGVGVAAAVGSPVPDQAANEEGGGLEKLEVPAPAKTAQADPTSTTDDKWTFVNGEVTLAHAASH